MKTETEIKIIGAGKQKTQRGVDIDKLRRRLVALGAQLRFKCVIREIGFTSRFLRKKSIKVRLRTVDGKNELAVKTKKAKSSRFLIRKEREVLVSDFGEMEGILETMGITKFRDREKEREEWLFDGVKIEIDRYPGYPFYVEIEGSPTAIATAKRKLGLSRHRCVAKTSTALLKTWGEKNPDFLKF